MDEPFPKLPRRQPADDARNAGTSLWFLTAAAYFLCRRSRRCHGSDLISRNAPPSTPPLAALSGIACEEAFMPAVSPTNSPIWNTNEHYKTDEEFRVALADALHEDTGRFVRCRLVLQIDDSAARQPLGDHPEIDLAQCRKWATASVELLEPRAARQFGRAHPLHTYCMLTRVMGPRVTFGAGISFRAATRAKSSAALIPAHTVRT